MFRHSTKQSVKSQEVLRNQATRALNNTSQILCSSVYTNTYDTNLPSTSTDMLDNIIYPMTGCNSRASTETRKVFTVAILEYEQRRRVRICFVQPEVSSATGNTPRSASSMLSDAKARLVKAYNNPTPGRIAVSSKKCQIAGRLAPYIVEESGLSRHVSWSYFNASKSRLVYIVTSPEHARLMSLTRDTISIYQSFCVQDCAIVYVPTTKCFKITVAPEEDDDSDDPNKSTCIFLYHDGTFKVLGTPHKSYKVCKLFRETIIRAHTSSMHSRILDTLCVAQDIGTQRNS